MKKVNSIVRGFLVGFLAFVSVVAYPSNIALAAGNESVAVGGADVRAILTNNGISDSDFNSTKVWSLDFTTGTSISTSFVGDTAYGLSSVGSNTFVAAGKYSTGAAGGLQVLGTATMYGKADNYTYSKVFAVSDSSIFAAYLDSTYAPFLESASYSGSTFTSGSAVPLNPATSTGDITAMTVSNGFAYVATQDSVTSGGYVNIVNTSNMTVAGTYTTTDAVTSVAVNGTTLYIGHGSTVDIVNVSNPASPSPVSNISVGAQVNGLTTDGTNLYIANGNGLTVYKLSNTSVVAGTFNTPKAGTAVSVNGGFIYLATGDKVYKIENTTITLNGVNPATVQQGATYTDAGATVTGGSSGIPKIDSSAVKTSVIGSYNVTITAQDSLGNLGLQITRTVNVIDAVGPVITLTGPNPQTVQLGANCYTELGATTDDGSLVTIDSSAVNCSVAGSYTVTYNAIDAAGNAAVPKTRTVVVAAVTHTVTASAGANGVINPTGAIIVADKNNQSFTMTPNSGFMVSDVLVDGVSVGPVYNYTFTNVTVNHTIAVSFVAGTYYTIDASTSGNGTITPSGSVFVNRGNSQIFVMTASSGYRITSLSVDNTSVAPAASYIFTNVTANHTIVLGVTAIDGSGSSGGGGGGGSGGNGTPVLRQIPGCGMRTTGVSTVTGESCAYNIPHPEVLGAEKFIFTLFLKRTTPPPYPKTPAAYVNEIMELQKFLNNHGYQSGPVDGKFGPITEGAVMRFQRANGLVADGIVGPLTRAVLNR